MDGIEVLWPSKRVPLVLVLDFCCIEFTALYLGLGGGGGVLGRTQALTVSFSPSETG